MKRITFVIGCLLAIITMAQAQTDCESMLEAADGYYNKGEYRKAADMYKIVQEECGNNFGGAATKLKDCNGKLKENADYNKCTTVEACDYYLETYPKGRYVAKVQQKREKLIRDKENARLRAEEDAAYENCTTEEDCEEYLEDYPDGRYVEQVQAKLEQLIEERHMREEDDAYAKCTTESACAKYMAEYPNGRYYSRVVAKKNTLEAEHLRKEKEAARTAYMKIKKVEFGNTDASNNIINGFGSTLYASEIKYLTPKITYDGILDEAKLVSIKVKIFRPNGTMISGSSASSDYTYSETFWVYTGSNNSRQMIGWGNASGGSYSSGTYRFEFWYEGTRIYHAYVIVKDKENALSRGNWRSALRKCRDYVMQTYDNGSYKGQLYDGSRSGLGMYSWNSGTYYVGNWNSGSKNGRAIYMAEQGYIVSNCADCVYYVGGWSSGDKSGSGTCYDKFGNLIYDGDFSNDKPTGSYPMTGYNSYKFECQELSGGDYYVGETRDGKRHGKGIYIWSSGDMWYGQWKDGIRDGYGIYMPYQGSVSTGTWKGDTKQ